MSLFRSLLAVGFALGVFAGPVRGQDSAILDAAQADMDTKASQFMILVHIGGGFGF
jgi:hypothetical protein